MESHFVPAGPVHTVYKFWFIIVTHYSRSFFRIVRLSSIYMLQLGLVNVFIEPIILSCFNNMNYMHLHRYVCHVEYLKCCSNGQQMSMIIVCFLRIFIASGIIN